MTPKVVRPTGACTSHKELYDPLLNPVRPARGWLLRGVRHNLDYRIALTVDQFWDGRFDFGELSVLSLLERSGFVELESGPVLPRKGWTIRGATLRPFGVAMYGIVSEQGLIRALWESEEQKLSPGQLQKVLQPLFSDYRRTFSPEEIPVLEGECLLRISMSESRFWRRVLVSGSLTLIGLCKVILEVASFDSDHLCAFSWRDVRGRKRNAEGNAYESTEETDVEIKAIGLAVGGQMELTYDFGDNWLFMVELEGIEPARLLPCEFEVPDGRGTPPRRNDSWDDEEDWRDEDETE